MAGRCLPSRRDGWAPRGTEGASAVPQVTPQVTPQVAALLKALGAAELDRARLQEKLGLSDRKSFRALYLAPAMEQGLVEFTLPDKPNSRLQKYRATVAGKTALR